MRIHLFRLLGVGALAVALTLPGASLADANHGQPDHAVPVKAVFEGSDYIVMPPTDCPPGAWWRYFFEGTGQMSHLGRVHIDVTHCTTFDPATGTGFFGPGTMTVTAMNGDVLVLEDTGTFVFDGVDSQIDLHWTVLEGTGRFVGATGGGDASVATNVPTASSAGEMWGSIIYDASNRAGR